MLNQNALDQLDPLDRMKFDETPIRRWRITWPDGTTEMVEGHMTLPHANGIQTFNYSYLGAHKTVNLQHVREIEEIPAD